MKNYLFTSESVTEGHPDKLCDNLSDKILSECMKQDEHSRVAVEVMAAKDTMYVAGQITGLGQCLLNDFIADQETIFH